MITNTIRVKTEQGIYDLELKSRYTIIQGLGGRGKTSMLDQNPRKYTLPDGVVLAVSQYTVNVFLKTEVSVIIMDEYVSEDLSNTTVAAMELSDKKFILFCRDLPQNVHYSYKDVYYMHRSGKYYSLRRIYGDYLSLSPDTRSAICEDAKSGYEYWCSRLTNVRTAYENSGFKKSVELGDTIIADGAAFGQYIEDYADDYKMFLPDSFEQLVCSAMFPMDVRVIDAYTLWDPTVYKTLERYYAALLNTLLSEKGLHYAKGKCPESVLHTDLTGVQQEIKVPMELLLHPVWKKFCNVCKVQDSFDIYTKLCNACKSTDVDCITKYISDTYLIVVTE